MVVIFCDKNAFKFDILFYVPCLANNVAFAKATWGLAQG